jgi:glycosyltransferase involved in cell wall biosynthesis
MISRAQNKESPSSNYNSGKISVVIPAKNEAPSLESLLPELRATCPDAQIILVNDGSTDNTSEICAKNNVQEVRHLYSKGNGAAIKAGTRAASGDIIVFMDADGQHSPADIKALIDKLDKGYDMVVGARSRKGQANKARWLANAFYNRFSSWMVDQKIRDLTSGFRVVKARKFKPFLYLLPNGFSYPTTSTIAFFRAGYSVGYIDIDVQKREGKSHINYLKDGVRFLLIIFKVSSLYSPLKIFTPISMLFFILGLIRYAVTYASSGTFTNMSALMFSMAFLVFLMGLVSEQVTTLIYQSSGDNEET